MQSFIQHINKTLLEKFPLIWNTRLLWMMIIALLTHAIFYVLGLHTFTDTRLLQQYNAERIYIQNGILMLSIVCSVLMIVVWLVILFRNNSFKNYYPTSRWQLFFSFVIYFIILFSSSTFYTSYICGCKTYIINRYPDKKFKKLIETSNLAATFLSFSQENYTIDKRGYPAPFDTLYCETKEDQVDFNKPYLQRFNDEYQFYTIIEKRIPTTNDKALSDAAENSIYRRYINDSITLFAYRGEVVDVSSIVNTELSYYNYSYTFFNNYRGTSSYYSTDVYDGNAYRLNDKSFIEMNKKVYNFLKKNDATEFKKLFTSFLDAAKEFSIETNLTQDKWLSLINRNNFTVEKFITNGSMQLESEYSEGDDVAATTDGQKARDTPENRSKKEQFYKDRKTSYYFDASSLQTVYDNITSIKSYSYWHTTFHFQCWLAFGLSILLFVFRATGLPALLFSIIASTVISILLALLMMSLHIKDEIAMAYIVFAIGTAILLTPLLLLKSLKKPIQSIFINITLVGIIPYILLILAIIQLHQERYYRKLLGDDYYKHKPDLIFDILGEHLSYILLAAGFIFVLVYTTVIKKWKALPEG